MRDSQAKSGEGFSVRIEQTMVLGRCSGRLVSSGE